LDGAGGSADFAEYKRKLPNLISNPLMKWFLLLLLHLGSLSAQAQKIFSVPYESQADVKVKPGRPEGFQNAL
jgi:hypothetical protein